MSGGRIRTIKPEILEDEKAARLSSLEWRLWVSMWTLADDHGNLRGSADWIHGQVFWNRSDVTAEDTREALATLSRESLVTLYVVRGQQYASVTNWSRHQRVDKPGKAKVPGPKEADSVVEYENSRESREHSGGGGESSGDPRSSRASTSPSRSIPEGVQGECWTQARLDESGRPLPRKPVFPAMVPREDYGPCPIMVGWAGALGLDDSGLDEVLRDLRDKHGLRPHTLDWWDERWLRFVETAANSRWKPLDRVGAGHTITAEDFE